VLWLLWEWRRRARTCDGGSGGRPGEEDERVGPAHQRGRRGEGRVGRLKATGPAGRWASAGERGCGPRLGQKPEIGQSSKRNYFEFQLILEIWQKFGKLHNEI
jgi:hypothetical protein